MDMLQEQWDRNKFVCVGLDIDISRIPEYVRCSRKLPSIQMFNTDIIDGTSDLVECYKPNLAFYEAHGNSGISGLRKTIEYIRVVAPEVPIILDYKRGDIGKTNVGYITEAFEYLKADAVTVNPYLGQEAMKAFLNQKNKGIIALCRTSNPGAGEFQDLPVYADDAPRPGMPLYQYVAHRISRHWNYNSNCLVVVGATYPDELGCVREIIGDMPILIPGIGTQGGDIQKAVANGKDSHGQGMIINASSSILYASNGPDFVAAARRETQKLHDSINQYLASSTMKKE